VVPFRRKILRKAFKLFDLLIMACSFLLAAWAVYYQIDHITFGQFLSIRVKALNFGLFLGFLLAWHAMFSFFGLYRSKRFSTRWAEVIDVIKATSLGTLVIYITATLFRIQMVSPPFVAVFWTASSTIAISSRLMLRYGLERARIRGRNLRHMLVVGTNPRAVGFARKIEKKPELGYRIIGFVDDKWAGIGEFRKTGYALVADFNAFHALLRDRVIHEVVIGLPVNSYYQQASRIVALCEEQGIIVRLLLSSIFNLKLARSKTEQFEDDSVITLYTFPGPFHHSLPPILLHCPLNQSYLLGADLVYS
jgi:FlaA1/EpsC-like NDP-sugar epimerase